MSSNSGNADFWTKIQGICTIIGLGIGSLLTLVTLYLAILSYRQMNSIKQHIVAPTFGEPPPPYADPSAEKLKSKKHLFGVIPVPAALTGGGSSSDDEMARGNIRREVRRGRLGNRRWFIALLIVMIILACGVIAVAANISNIQKLSNSRSLSQAAVVPNSNPGLPTLPLTQATTATDRQTATSVALGKNIYSTTYIHGTAFIVFPGPTSIAVGDAPAGVTGIMTTASGTPYIVITGSTNIPISTTASLSTIATSVDSMTSPTADPSATESEDRLHAGPSLSSESELSSITSSSVSFLSQNQSVTVSTIMREVVIAGITFTDVFLSTASESQTSMSSSTAQIKLSVPGIGASLNRQSSAASASQGPGSQIVSAPTPPSTTTGSTHLGFVGFEFLSATKSSTSDLAINTQISPASIPSQSMGKQPPTSIAFNPVSSFPQLSTASSLPVSTSTTFKGGGIGALVSFSSRVQTAQLSPLSLTVSTSTVLSTFSVVIITTSVVLETSGISTTSLQLITSTIPIFQTSVLFQTIERTTDLTATSIQTVTSTFSAHPVFQTSRTTETFQNFFTSTLSAFQTFQTTESSLQIVTSTLQTTDIHDVFETIQTTATLIEVTTSTLGAVQTSLVFQTLDTTVTSLEISSEVTTSTIFTLQTSVVLQTSDVTETSLQIITAIPSEAATSVIFQTSEVTLTSLDVTTSILIENQIVEVTQTSLEIITATLLVDPAVIIQTSDVTRTSLDVITSFILQTSVLFETSTIQETLAVQTQMVLQTSSVYETSTETVLETVTEVYTTIVSQTSLLYETSTALEAATEVQTSLMIQTSVLYETSTILDSSTGVQTEIVLQTSAVYETSTIMETSTTLETSVVLETSTILETSLVLETSTLLETSTVLDSQTEVQTDMIFQTSILFETSTAFEIYTSVISQTDVPLDCPLTISTVTVSNPSATGTPSTYSYEGCISDNENRTLSGLHTTSASMTTEKCAKYCSGSAYFGTEYGSQCWCGNEIWQYAGISPTETNCNATCTGNQDEICGATWWMSLYSFD